MSERISHAPVRPNQAIPVVNGDLARLGRFASRSRGWLAYHAIAAKQIHQGLRASDSSLRAINHWHGLRGLYGLEGFMRDEQAKFFQDLLSDEPDVKNIAEIGFNGGHSSFVFLNARPNTVVTSFDIGEHDYVQPSADYIAGQFPGRHQLVIGDSLTTVPTFAAEHADARFDLIFIDGGHGELQARADIANMAGLAATKAHVVVDDYNENVVWGEGPTAAWNQAVRSRVVAQEAIISGDSRTWAVGHYI